MHSTVAAHGFEAKSIELWILVLNYRLPSQGHFAWMWRTKELSLLLHFSGSWATKQHSLGLRYLRVLVKTILPTRNLQHFSLPPSLKIPWIWDNVVRPKIKAQTWAPYWFPSQPSPPLPKASLQRPRFPPVSSIILFLLLSEWLLQKLLSLSAPQAIPTAHPTPISVSCPNMSEFSTVDTT